MQKSLGPKSTARRRPLRLLSGNKARPPPTPKSLFLNPPPRTPAAAGGPAVRTPATADAPASRTPAAACAPTVCSPAAAADAALDRLLLARSDIAGIVSQIDELISDALRCETVSKRGKQEIELFNGFLSDTNHSLKQWSSRLKQALETGPETAENVSKDNLGTCSTSVAKGDDKSIHSSLWSSRLKQALQIVPEKTETVSKDHLGYCSKSVAKGDDKLICCSSLPDTDPIASPCSNFTEADLIVSPSPLVSWRTGTCMVESGKQLFQLTPLPKTKTCSSRCPTSKTQMKTATSMDQLNLPSLPVWKLTISDDDHPDVEQDMKVNEAMTVTMTPHVATANKSSLEDRLQSPCIFSIQKSMRTLPRSCLKTALSSKQQFSPIPEDVRKEGIDSNGPNQGGKRSDSSDEVSKDLATRYDIYGLNQPTRTTYRRKQAEDPLLWYFSPPKTCVLMDLSDDKPLPTPARSYMKGKHDVYDEKPAQTPAVHSNALDQSGDKPLPTPARSNMKGNHNVYDDKPIQTPAVHSKALLGTPWKGMESTNLKGRQAGETTLKRELWTRFDAASTNELHFDKSLFQKMDGNRRFLDMLEEAS
nr:unnamed protein product [Digitaria exilis]